MRGERGGVALEEGKNETRQKEKERKRDSQKNNNVRRWIRDTERNNKERRQIKRERNERRDKHTDRHGAFTGWQADSVGRGDVQTPQQPSKGTASCTCASP